MFFRELNIVTLQRKDHECMERLLRSYETQHADRARIYANIVRLVTTHAFAEETVLFPAARRVLPGADALTSEIEGKHQRVNELMVAMQKGEPGEAAFEERAAELFSLLRADARQEEDQLLTALSVAASERQLRSVGLTWIAARWTAPNRPHPGVSRRPPWNMLAGIPLTLMDRTRRLFERLRPSRAD